MGNGLILFAHHDAVLCEQVRVCLAATGYELVMAADGAAAMGELHRVELDVAVIELALPGRSGLDVLAASHHLCPDTEVVIVADPADRATALECIAKEAFGYLQTPLDLDALLLMIARAVERRSLRATTRLFEASQEILRTPDQSLLAAAIVELVGRVLEADHVTLSLATVCGGMRERHSSAITPESRKLVAAEVGDHVATVVARLGRPVLLPEDAAAIGLSGASLDRVRSCIVYPLSTGRPVGVLTLSRITDNRPYRRVDIDRTAVLASQALLAVENAALSQCMLEAERLAAVGNLAAGVAHEINNPLTYVVASADHALEQISLLRRQISAGSSAPSHIEPKVCDVEEALEDVCDGARRIAAIARDLRALSRAESRTDQVLDLSQVVRAAQRVTAAQLRSKVVLMLDLLQGAWVLGDEGRLVQVFVNLMVNALQAAEGRKLILHIATTRCEGSIIATVRDDGPGIAPENLTAIFQPFFSTKTASIGTGLGLSLSQRIVTEHRGTITVESALGSGATFILCFPASEVADGGATQKDETEAA